MYNIHLVPQDKIEEIWPIIIDYVKDCIEIADGNMTVNDVYTLASTGSLKVYLALEYNVLVHGILMLQDISTVSGKTAFIQILAGKNIVTRKMMQQFKRILKDSGYTNVQALVRPSMKKLLNRFGFFEQKIIVGAPL